MNSGEIVKVLWPVLGHDAATFVWEGGIRIDSDVFYQDLLMTRAGKKFDGSELAPAVE